MSVRGIMWPLGTSGSQAKRWLLPVLLRDCRWGMFVHLSGSSIDGGLHPSVLQIRALSGGEHRLAPIMLVSFVLVTRSGKSHFGCDSTCL